MLLNKVNLFPILKAHFATLNDNGVDAKFSLGDYTLFFGLPAICGAIPLCLGFRFRIDAINGFLNVFAVLTGLLLNLLVLVVTLSTSTAPADVDPELRDQLVREVFANSCFAVIVAITVVCTALVALAYMRSTPGATSGPRATFGLVFLTANFVLTLAMVLKRMFLLLTREIGK
jgi:hypothetical protein